MRSKVWNTASRWVMAGLMVSLAACTQKPEFKDREFVPLSFDLEGYFNASEADFSRAEGQWGQLIVSVTGKASLLNLLRDDTDADGNVTYEATTAGMEIRGETGQGDFKDRRNSYAKGMYDTTASVVSWLDLNKIRWKLFARQLTPDTATEGTGDGTEAVRKMMAGEYHCLTWSREDASHEEGIVLYESLYSDGLRTDIPVSTFPPMSGNGGGYRYEVTAEGRLTLTNDMLKQAQQAAEAELAAMDECKPEGGGTGLNERCSARAGLFGFVGLDGDLISTSKVVDKRIKPVLAEDETLQPQDEWGTGGRFEICLKKGREHTQAELAGEYWVHLVEKVGGSWRGARGELTLDAEGEGTLTTLDVSAGSSPRTLAVSVHVESDGQLTVNGKSGALSPNGDLWMFDASNELTEPVTLGMAWVMRKRPLPQE